MPTDAVQGPGGLKLLPQVLAAPVLAELCLFLCADWVERWSKLDLKSGLLGVVLGPGRAVQRMTS